MVYGGAVFSAHNFYFWIPVIVPHVGGALAAVLYKNAIEVKYKFYHWTILYPNVSYNL